MPNLTGQWLGTSQGPSPDIDEGHGQVILNIELRDGKYVGTVVFAQRGNNLPWSIGNANLELNGVDINAQITNVMGIHPEQYIPIPIQKIREFYSNDFNMPYLTAATGRITGHKMNVTWQSNIGTNGNTELLRSPQNRPSDLKQKFIQSWTEFKNHVSTLDLDSLIFRGQSHPWKLQTSFHRCGRYDLIRYCNEDMPRLQQYVNAVSPHFFRTEDPRDFGALINLAQHHGFPTPLLDWTRSPYIAAYFAFQDADETKEGNNVRILAFNRKKWQGDFYETSMIGDVRLNIGVYEFFGIQNPRVLPQQSVTTFSNVDDMENYIRTRSIQTHETYLYAFDIPAARRQEVMRDLALMGITPASLFPGLDGICKELRQRFFE